MAPKTASPDNSATGGKPSENQETEKGLLVQAGIVGGIVVIVLLLVFFGVI